MGTSPRYTYTGKVLNPRQRSKIKQVFIHCGDEGMRAELESLLGDETLERRPERSNGVDDLRFVLMVSKVRELHQGARFNLAG